MGRIVKVCCFLCILLVISCENDGGHNTLFTKLSSADTGIDFNNLLRETEDFNVMKYGYFYNGSGVAVGDINNDSLPDIYFTGNMVASHLYVNKGNWQFEEMADQAGVAAAGMWNTGVTMADVDGDGWLDIYVCRSAAAAPNNRKNLLFINNRAAPGRDLTFTEQAEAYGLADPAYSTQASFFDYDRDGDLDMYLLNHSVQDYAGFNKFIGNYKNRKNSNYGDKLFRNDGSHFTNVTDSAGIINNVLGFGLGVTVSDMNGDDWPDIYISNDYNEEDYLYLNQQNGTFKESLADCMGHVSLFSMGADGADINNDLRTDIITLDMLPESNYQQKMALGPEHYDKYQQLINNGFFPQTMRNMLQLNEGNGYFSEIGQLAGISNTNWSWAVLAADYDNDGWKDLFITNGYMRNYLDMDFLNYVVGEKVKSQQGHKEIALLDLIDKMPPIEVENYIYKNNGATPGRSLTFSKKSEEWGMDDKTISNAAAYADLDNDGDLDLIVSHVNAEAGIYQNNSESLSENHYLKVRLQGSAKNSFGVGAKVFVYAGDKHLYQEMIPVRGYQSSMNYELVFGLGATKEIDSLEVIWPEGMIQKMHDVPVNQIVTLHQQEAKERKPQHITSRENIFSEVAGKLGIDFKHVENNFLDFKRDRMLPYGISTSGPKIVQGDVNQDGLDDLYVGGAKGSSGKLFTQKPDGTFREVDQKSFEADKESEDTDGLFVDVDGDGDLDLYLVSGGSDFAEDSPALQDRLYLNDGKGNFKRQHDKLPEMLSSGSSVTAGDIDHDGDVDLFVGGRLVPGKYPLPPRSYLLRNDGQGKFDDMTSEFCPALRTPGMVTDAQFLKANGDNWIDLVVVGEWMEVAVYINEEGKRLNQQQDVALAATSGWWNTIEAQDFDRDGDIDMVLGNFGLNNPYQPDPKHPATLVYNDFDHNGSIDPIFSYYIEDTNAFAYSRDELIGQIPALKKKFPDYQSFAVSNPASFFSSEERADADTLSAQLLETIYLQNDGNGHFSLKILPIEAQFAPVYALTATDVNQDGHLDIITGGNLSRTRVSTGKYDANYGIVLLGDGKGSFTTLDPSFSGLKIKGDVRDINILKIKDSDFAVFSRNDDSIKVFKISKQYKVDVPK